MRQTETTRTNRLASCEAEGLLQRATARRGSASGRALSPAAQAAWGSVEGGLDQLGQAFGLPARLP